ncbi:hypothetical protein RHECNPAF_12210062 [Rhizobium etli CNPAF512]|nr:hypothetical protein RHECNPAF_12210062 [Rhizobium etli CNPAF512]
MSRPGGQPLTQMWKVVPRHRKVFVSAIFKAGFRTLRALEKPKLLGYFGTWSPFSAKQECDLSLTRMTTNRLTPMSREMGRPASISLISP